MIFIVVIPKLCNIDKLKKLFVRKKYVIHENNMTNSVNFSILQDVSNMLSSIKNDNLPELSVDIPI